MSRPLSHIWIDAQVGQTGVRVNLVPVVVPLHVVPTSVPDVVHPPLDAFSVQIEHQQENDADQRQHQPQEHVRCLQNALQAAGTLQLRPLDLYERLASQALGLWAGQVLHVDDLSGVFQPRQHVLDEAVAAPGVPRQLDPEGRLEAELCQGGGGQVLQAVVPQVKVTQQRHLQRPVLDGDDGAVLQAEVEQAGEAGEYVIRKNHKVVVGQVEDFEPAQVSLLQEAQDHVHDGMIVKRPTEVQDLQRVIMGESLFTESLEFVAAQVQPHKVWQVVKYLCIHRLQLVPAEIEIC